MGIFWVNSINEMKKVDSNVIESLYSMLVSEDKDNTELAVATIKGFDEAERQYIFIGLTIKLTSLVTVMAGAKYNILSELCERFPNEKYYTSTHECVRAAFKLNDPYLEKIAVEHIKGSVITQVVTSYDLLGTHSIELDLDIKLKKHVEAV